MSLLSRALPLPPSPSFAAFAAHTPHIMRRRQRGSADAAAIAEGGSREKSASDPSHTKSRQTALALQFSLSTFSLSPPPLSLYAAVRPPAPRWTAPARPLCSASHQRRAVRVAESAGPDREDATRVQLGPRNAPLSLAPFLSHAPRAAAEPQCSERSAAAVRLRRPISRRGQESRALCVDGFQACPFPRFRSPLRPLGVCLRLRRGIL